MAAKIQHKRAAAARWALVNPVLDAGEIGYETDTGKFKIGIGGAQWLTLPYAATQPGHQHPITDIVGLEEVIDDRLNTTLVAGDNISLVYDDAANALTIAANVDGGVIVHAPAGPFTLYFNGAVDNDWATLGNWWLDDEHTVPATALPTAADSVVVTAGLYTGPATTATLANLTVNSNDEFYGNYVVSGAAVFEPGVLGDSSAITGNVTFNGGSANGGTVTGNATFNNSAINNNTVAGNATFNTDSSNSGSVTGNATFRNNCVTDGNIGGNAVFYDSAQAQSGGDGILGSATFYNNSGNSGTIGVNAVFNDSAENELNGVIGGAAVGGSVEFFENSKNYGTIGGLSDPEYIVLFEGFSDCRNHGNIYGTVTFANESRFHSGTVFGEAIFVDDACNVNGNAQGFTPNPPPECPPPPAAPNAPTALTATAGNQQLSLAWTVPSAPGTSAITGYVVEYTPSGGSASTVNTNSTSTSYTLTGLTNGTSYTVRVAAISAAGTGAYSATATGTPASGPTITVTGGTGLTGAGTDASRLTGRLYYKTFTFSITGAGTLYYQIRQTAGDGGDSDSSEYEWKRSGVNIPGHTFRREFGCCSTLTNSFPVNSETITLQSFDGDWNIDYIYAAAS